MVGLLSYHYDIKTCENANKHYLWPFFSCTPKVHFFHLKYRIKISLHFNI